MRPSRSQSTPEPTQSSTLGVFLLIAAHRSLIWFTVVSSVAQAAIMAVQAVTDPAEHGHLQGDVPALLLVAIVLTVLMSRAAKSLAPERT